MYRLLQLLYVITAFCKLHYAFKRLGKATKYSNLGSFWICPMAFPRATILSDNKAQVMTVAHETGKIALEIMTLYKLHHDVIRYWKAIEKRAKK